MNPTRACLHPDGTGVAIWAAGSPDLERQAAAFDRDHRGPGHQRVERLPERNGKGDVQMGAK